MRKRNSPASRWRRNLLDYGAHSRTRTFGTNPEGGIPIAGRTASQRPCHVRGSIELLKQERQKALRIEDEQETNLKATPLRTRCTRNGQGGQSPVKPLFLGYNTKGKPIRLKPDDRRIHMHSAWIERQREEPLPRMDDPRDFKNRQDSVWSIRHGELYDSVVAYSARYGSQRRDCPPQPIRADTVVGFQPFSDSRRIGCFSPSRSSHHRHHARRGR